MTDLPKHAPGLVSPNGGTLDRPLALVEDAHGEILIIDGFDQAVYRLVGEGHVEQSALKWTPCPRQGPLSFRFAG